MNTENETEHNIRLKVIGLGGAGNNAINLMLDENLPNVKLYVANTDSQDLVKSKCDNKIILGKTGFGAGGDPEKGRQCALESIDAIRETLKDTDILIISAGLGGGTGTGAAPVFAQAAKEMGIITLAIVSTPFNLEGKRKLLLAEQGLDILKQYVDSYVVLSNQKLVDIYHSFPIKETFKCANQTLKNTIQIIHNVIYETGYMNIDFNDLRQVLSNGGESIISLAQASGKDRALKAVEDAIYSPIFRTQIKTCDKIAIIFRCDKKTSFDEIQAASNLIEEQLALNENAEKFLGIQYVETSDKQDFFQVNIIASNINKVDYNNMNLNAQTSVYNLQQQAHQVYDNNSYHFNNTIPYNQNMNAQPMMGDQSNDDLPEFFS